MLGSIGERVTIAQFFECPEDIFDAVDLAGESVAGKNALASTTVGIAAPSQNDSDSLILARLLEASLHPGLCEHKLTAATAVANATRKNRIIAARDVLGVSGRINVKYVHQHVPRRPRLFGKLFSRGRHFNSIAEPPNLLETGRDADGNSRERLSGATAGCHSQTAAVTTSSRRLTINVRGPAGPGGMVHSYG